MRYEVIVGNIGTVLETNNPVEANKIYGEYKRMSIIGRGRAGNEPAVLLDAMEIKYEHLPDQN